MSYQCHSIKVGVYAIILRALVTKDIWDGEHQIAYEQKQQIESR